MKLTARNPKIDLWTVYRQTPDRNFGFVVSRFGLFVQWIGLQTGHTPEELLTQASPLVTDHALLHATLGVAFVLASSLLNIVAAFQQRRFLATLSPIDLPPSYSKSFAVVVSLAVALLGIVLAGYLLLTHPSRAIAVGRHPRVKPLLGWALTVNRNQNDWAARG